MTANPEKNIAVEVRVTGSSIQFGAQEELGIQEHLPQTNDGRRFLVLKDVPSAAK